MEWNANYCLVIPSKECVCVCVCVYIHNPYMHKDLWPQETSALRDKRKEKVTCVNMIHPNVQKHQVGRWVLF